MPLTLANKITILRIILVPIFVAVVLYYKPERDYYRFIALGIFILAALLDVLDGYIARKGKEITKAGALLDPLADKVLLVSAFISLYFQGMNFPTVHFPIWLVVAVISRDAFLLIGAIVVHVAHCELVIKPNFLGKVTTFSQVLCVIGMLIQFPYSSIIWIMVLILTVFSGLYYLTQGFRMLSKGAA